MALYDHLCPDENISLTFSKRRKDFFMVILFSGSICIHPQYPGSGKAFLHQALDLLCACPESSDVRGTAYRTLLNIHSLIAAVMADQPAVSVGRQRHITVGTFHYMAAGTAGYKPAVSSPVQKQDHLLLSLQSFLDLSGKQSAEYRTVSCL